MSNIDDLKARITTTIASVDANMFAASCHEVDYRFDILHVTKGAHVEVHWQGSWNFFWVYLTIYVINFNLSLLLMSYQTWKWVWDFINTLYNSFVIYYIISFKKKKLKGRFSYIWNLFKGLIFIKWNFVKGMLFCERYAKLLQISPRSTYA